MKIWVTGLFVVLLAGAAFYYVKILQPPSEVPPPPVLSPVQTEQAEPEPVPVEPAVVEPVAVPVPEPEIEAEPLPSLAESDELVLETLSGLMGEASVMRFLVRDNLVSRFVASVDALTGRQVPGRIMAIQGPAGDTVVTAVEQPDTVIRNAEGDPIPQYLLNPANYQRYIPLVETFESLDAQDLVNLYREYASLGQQAYSELGYPDGDFGDRLIEVVDNLLATPEIREPLRLIKPEAYYLFADPELEALPAGQKVLLRMGSDNAQRVKAKLREIRVVLQNAG